MRRTSRDSQIALSVFTLSVLIAMPAFADEVCGVKVRPAVESIAKYVVEKTGHEIICNFQNSDSETASGLIYEGKADFVNSSPRITINMGAVDPEMLIAHELFHLKLVASGEWGFDDFHVSLPCQIKISGSELQRRTQRFDDMAHSDLEHRIFFPKMREMGFDPNEQTNSYFRGAPFADPPPLNRQSPELMSLYYARFEETDREKRDQIVDLMLKSGFGRQVELGKRLLKIIQRDNPRNQKQGLATEQRLIQETFCDDRNLSMGSRGK